MDLGAESVMDRICGDIVIDVAVPFLLYRGDGTQ